MARPGRRGAARGPAEMGAPGGEAAAAAGPARFQCPEEFCARRFAPGAAFRPETPGKRLLLIRAPADFRPESLSGHRLALLGSQLLRASQPDGSPKVFSLRAGPEESGARLLIAAGQPERLTCAQPFAGALRIQERPAGPGASPALFPVAERPPPQVPEGLKQRFFPFGARLQGPAPSSEAAWKAARKRGKKQPLLPLKPALWQPEGPEQLRGDSPDSARGLLKGWARAGSEHRPLEEEEEARPPVLWQAAQRRGHFEEGSWSGEGEEPDRRARKKEQMRKTGLGTEELLDPSSRYGQPEQDPWLQGEREPEGAGGDWAGEPAGCKAKKKKKKKKKKTTQEAGAEGLWSAFAIKEEPLDVPCLGSLPEENPGAMGEDPAGEVSSCKRRRRRRSSRERVAEGLRACAIKEEPGDVPCLGGLLEDGRQTPREEPGRALAGYIKQSPGKGAEGLWGIAAFKEELGDVSLGSLAEESRGVAPEDPAAELPSCKKKKSRERVGEGLWGVAAIQEEPGGLDCLGSPPEDSLGSARGGHPAGELLACKKKKKKGGKLDKEPLQGQGTEAQRLGSTVLDWAAPLWQEAGPEDPLQTNGAAPSPRLKKKRRREGEDQARLSAAGT